MPQVPGLDSSTPQLSQNVPGVQLPYRGEFGREGAAYKNLSEGLGQVASAGNEIYDEVQRQHDISTSSLAVTQMKVSHNEMRENLQLNSPDGFIHTQGDDGEDERVQNRDGSFKTIAQQYWENADADSLNAQKNMSPRAAAMFRTQAQPLIAENTQRLQGEGLRLQANATEQKMDSIKDIFAKDMSRSPVPDVDPYYTAAQQDGSTREYPSMQKFFDAVQATQLTRQQLGNTQGKGTEMGATEVEALKKSDASYLANQQMTSLKYDLMNSAGSRAALHNQLKDANTSAVMQIHSALDILDGKDPQSQDRSSKDLPTVNSSLTPEQIDKWKKDLLGMIPAGKEVDKSEYHLQNQQLGDFAKNVKSLDEFNQSDLLKKVVMMGDGLGLTPAERVKDIAPHYATAILSAATNQVTGINSPAAKRKAAEEVMHAGAIGWPQQAAMMGEDHTEGFGQAILGEVPRQVDAKLVEDEAAMRRDPIKYASKITDDPTGRMANTIQNRLNPNSGDPSLLAVFGKMGNSTVLEKSQANSNNIHARMFGQTQDVPALDNDLFKGEAKKLTESHDPQLVTSYFNELDKSKLSPTQKEQFVQDLVHKGGLPQTYVDPLNLATPQEREATWARLKSGPAPLPQDLNQKDLSNFAAEDNKGIANFLNLKFGTNSDTARTTLKSYQTAYMENVKQAMAPPRSMGEADARQFARNQQDKTTGAIGVVQGQHDFFGASLLPDFLRKSGPAIPVEYGLGKNYTDAQKQKINDTLLYYQSHENLASKKFEKPPGALPSNSNAPYDDAGAVESRLAMWQKSPGGWRLYQSLSDKDNLGTGQSQPVRYYGTDTQAHYLEVKESEALSGPPQGAPHAIAPAPRNPAPNIYSGAKTR